MHARPDGQVAAVASRPTRGEFIQTLAQGEGCQ